LRWWFLEKPFCFDEVSRKYRLERLRALATDATGKLDVLRHDGDSLGVDGGQVGVLEKTNKVSLSSLLKSKDGRALESQVGLEVLGDLTHKSLERKLADEELSGLLVTSDLTKSHSSRAVSVGLLDTTGGGGRLASSLGGELLSGGLASSGLTCGLLSTGHFSCENCELAPVDGGMIGMSKRKGDFKEIDFF